MVEEVPPSGSVPVLVTDYTFIIIAKQASEQELVQIFASSGEQTAYSLLNSSTRLVFSRTVARVQITQSGNVDEQIVIQDSERKIFLNTRGTPEYYEGIEKELLQFNFYEFLALASYKFQIGLIFTFSVNNT